LSRITIVDLPPDGGPSSSSSRRPTSEPAAGRLEVIDDAIERRRCRTAHSRNSAKVPRQCCARCCAANSVRSSRKACLPGCRSDPTVSDNVMSRYHLVLRRIHKGARDCSYCSWAYCSSAARRPFPLPYLELNAEKPLLAFRRCGDPHRSPVDAMHVLGLSCDPFGHSALPPQASAWSLPASAVGSKAG
jgi:hypothetical protein